MPFAWRQFEPTRVGQVEKYDIPLNDWLGIKFGEGLSSGLGRAAWERGEDFAWDTGEKVSPEILNKSFAIEGYLEFKEPTTTGRAFLMRERKLEELERMKLLDSASHSALSGKAFAGFIAGMAGGFANPVDLSTAFIPFVGSTAKASQIAKLGKGLAGAQQYGRFRQAIQTGRAAIARGIVPQEAIGAGRGAQLSAAMIDGVLSQAAVEIPIAIQKARNEAEYGLQDSLFNVLAGGLFAGGLNLAGQALEAAYKRAIKSAVDFHVRANPETKEALFREHEDALLSGRKPDTAAIIRLDEEAIRRKVEAERFDAEAAKMEGMRNEQMWTELRGEVTVAVEKANKALADGDVAGAVAAIQALPTSGEMVGAGVDITKQIPGLKKLAQELPDLNRIMVDDRPFSQWLNDVEVGKISTLTKYQSLTDEQLKKIVASKRPEPFKKAAREILESRQLAQDFPYQRAVETERQKRIAEFVEKKRQEWKDGLEGRVSKAKQAEIARQQAEGKILSKEDADRYKSKADADRADVEIVKQDTQNINRELTALKNSPDLSDAEKAELQRELDELNGEVTNYTVTETPEDQKSTRLSDETLAQYLSRPNEMTSAEIVKREKQGEKLFTIYGEDSYLFDVNKWVTDLESTPEEIDPSVLSFLSYIKNEGKLDVFVVVENIPADTYQGRYTHYDPTAKGVIAIRSKLTNGKFLTKQQFSRTLAHEIVHRVVTSKLEYSGYKGLMYKLYTHAKKIADERGFGKWNAWKDLDEFVADAFSKKEVREFLLEIKSPLEELDFRNLGWVINYQREEDIGSFYGSAWGGFLNMVRKVLGIAAPKSRQDFLKQLSVLDDVVFISEHVRSFDRMYKNDSLTGSTYSYIRGRPDLDFRGTIPCILKFE